MENNLTFTVERLNPGTIGQDLADRRWGSEDLYLCKVKLLNLQIKSH